MAKTWDRKKKGKKLPYKSTDAYSSRRVLRDAYRIKSILKNKELTQAEWRINWLAIITILRSVGYVLKNIDSKRSKYIKEAIDLEWKKVQRPSIHNAIFNDFIDKHRHLIIKEYQFDAHTLEAELESMSPNEQLMLIGTETISKLEAIEKAIVWWESLIDRIEMIAEDNKKQSKV